MAKLAGIRKVKCDFCEHQEVISVRENFFQFRIEQVYSDQRRIGRPHFEVADPPIVFRCQSCRLVQTLSATSTDETTEVFSPWEMLKYVVFDSLEIIPVRLEDVVEALELGIVEESLAMFNLRCSMVRLANDPFRKLADANKMLLSTRNRLIVDQARRLTFDYTSQDAESLAMAIECRRELGQFEKATELISKDWDYNDELSELYGIAQIERWCKERNPYVQVISAAPESTQIEVPHG